MKNKVNPAHCLHTSNMSLGTEYFSNFRDHNSHNNITMFEKRRISSKKEAILF